MTQTADISQKLSAYVQNKMGSKSLRTCATEIGIPTMTLCRAKNGHDIPLSGFVKIVSWLGCSSDCLLGLNCSNDRYMTHAKMELVRVIQEQIKNAESYLVQAILDIKIKGETT